MLARIISDCALANYSAGDWAQISECDWLTLMREARFNARMFDELRRIFENRRYGLRELDEIVARRRQECIEVLDWFRGRHETDYLGWVCRDIVGVIESYLRIRIRTKMITREREHVGYTFKYKIMSRDETYDGLPETVRVYMRPGYAAWSCVQQWSNVSWVQTFKSYNVEFGISQCTYEMYGPDCVLYPLTPDFIDKCIYITTMHRSMCW